MGLRVRSFRVISCHLFYERLALLVVQPFRIMVLTPTPPTFRDRETTIGAGGR